jgi:prepilin-type N-terminal cleavage/methylation domain-containing protein
MKCRHENIDHPNRGYSLIEMLIVTAVIIILATMPIALVRRSREKVWEAQAVRALGMMSLAYDNYWAQAGHKYPNFRSDHALQTDIDYVSAESIWDDLVRRSLVPRQYSCYPHKRRDLLARGYVMSIYPADYGGIPGGGARNTYAIGMIPYQGSIAKRPLVIIQGQRFYSSFPTAVPHKMGFLGPYSTTIYTLPD